MPAPSPSPPALSDSAPDRSKSPPRAFCSYSPDSGRPSTTARSTACCASPRASPNHHVSSRTSPPSTAIPVNSATASTTVVYSGPAGFLRRRLRATPAPVPDRLQSPLACQSVSTQNIPPALRQTIPAPEDSCNSKDNAPADAPPLARDRFQKDSDQYKPGPAPDNKTPPPCSVSPEQPCHTACRS